MEVLITEFAKQSLSENLIFLYKQGAPVNKVLEIHERVLDAIALLAHNPHLGQVENLIDDGLHRRLVVGNYKVIYIITPEKVIVKDIFDSRQNPSKISRGND